MRRIEEHRHEALLPGISYIKDEHFLQGIMSGKYAFIADKNIFRPVKLDSCFRNPNLDFHISVESVMTMANGFGFRKGLDNKIVREVDNVYVSIISLRFRKVLKKFEK